MEEAELTTERLALTRPRASDAAGVLAVLGDPRTVAHNPSDRLAGPDEATALVERWVRHWEEHGFGYWCVREQGADDVVGYAGVKRMEVHGRPVLNLVYRLVPEVWGRGLATEAAAAVLARVAVERPTETVVARVRPRNLASRQVALKIGLRRDEALDCEGEDGLDHVYSSRPEAGVCASGRGEASSA